MIPHRLPVFSVSQLEEKAIAFLNSSLGAVSIPIDVEFLVESREDADLDFYPGLQANHGVLGAVFLDVETRRFLVMIDDRLADDEAKRNRYRMTVAEELAHIHLHGDLIRQLSEVDDFKKLQGHADWIAIERNAKRFAAAILMPGKLLMDEANRLYGEFVRAVGYNNIPSIQNFLKSKLATRFEVSPQAMGIRLNEWPMKILAKVEASMNARIDFLSDP